MALSLIIRNSIKAQGRHDLFKISAILIKNTATFSQTLNPTKLNAASKANLMLFKPTIRNVSLTVARKSAHADHSGLWKAERILSIALMGIIPAALLMPNQLLDNLMALSIVVHMHWGIEANVLDYIRPIIFGNTIPKLAQKSVYLVSIVTLGGLLYFNYHDIGLARAVKKIWALKPAD